MSLISGFVKSLSKLSMIGRALMLPISLLPAAGLLLAFGDKFHLPLMMNAGGVIFDNLPMLFAIGSAVGLASESGIAALSALLLPTYRSIPVHSSEIQKPEVYWLHFCLYIYTKLSMIHLYAHSILKHN